jgi:hypothetical protein
VRLIFHILKGLAWSPENSKCGCSLINLSCFTTILATDSGGADLWGSKGACAYAVAGASPSAAGTCPADGTGSNSPHSTVLALPRLQLLHMDMRFIFWHLQ